MRIHGKLLPKPKDDVVVLPRGDEQIVFNIRAVIDYKPFNEICPLPKPKMVTVPGDGQPVQEKGPDWEKRVTEYAMRQQHWTMIQSLMATPGLEWNKVKLDDPSTWHLWMEELEEEGLTAAERVRIQTAIHKINGLDDSLLEQARTSFLATKREQEKKLSSQQAGQNSIPSGEPANDSESDPEK